LTTVFTDAVDVVFDATIRYDDIFFVSLDRIVQNEPWLGRDRAMIDILRTIGIEKGKPFNTDLSPLAQEQTARVPANTCVSEFPCDA
jgi:hypothetical protein